MQYGSKNLIRMLKMQLHSSGCSVRLGIKSGLYSISSFYYKAIFFHSVNHLIPRLMSSPLNIKKERTLWKTSWKNIPLISMKKSSNLTFSEILSYKWPDTLTTWKLHFQTVAAGLLSYFKCQVYILLHSLLIE